MKYIIQDKDYLQHHGIKGQKWGVENGPPYPLNKNVSTKIIEQSRREAIQSKGGPQLFSKNRVSDIDVALKLKNKIDNKDITTLSNNAKKLSSDNIDNIHNVVNNLHKVTNSKEFKNDVKNEINSLQKTYNKHGLKISYDDVEDIAMDLLNNKYSNKLGYNKSINAKYDKHIKDTDLLVNKMISGYGDLKIKGVTSLDENFKERQATIKDIMDKTVKSKSFAYKPDTLKDIVSDYVYDGFLIESFYDDLVTDKESYK